MTPDDPAYLLYAAAHDAVGYAAWATMLTLAAPTFLLLAVIGDADD